VDDPLSLYRERVNERKDAYRTAFAFLEEMWVDEHRRLRQKLVEVARGSCWWDELEANLAQPIDREHQATLTALQADYFFDVARIRTECGL
jgi:hypothetical protein